MEGNIFIVGHSHVECLRKSAASLAERGLNVNILNLNILQRVHPEGTPLLPFIKDAVSETPDAICLCLYGNKHNVLGLLEHPQPFSVGDEEKGAVPDGYPDRWFIPYNVMRDSFSAQYDNAKSLVCGIFDHFNNAKRLILNAPPPTPDWEHISSHPNSVFKHKLHLGPAPDALRLKLYQIQTSVVNEIADTHGAKFIDLSDEVSTKDGFLKSCYYTGSDSTHGNRTYGAVVMNRMVQKLGYA